jgi:CDP-6-deoxy-D-xylo-4-hexulose-3-dehydrase
MNGKYLNFVKQNIQFYFQEIENKKRKFVASNSKIPLAVPPYNADEVIEALDSLLTMKTTMSEKVKKFEILFAKYLRVKYALMVNSGSSANLLALSILANPLLRKKRIRKGDEIITTPVTWPTTVYPIINIGAIPVFVDVNMNDYNIDTDKIENAITKKSRAIMLVHLLGHPCNMNKIIKIAKKHDLLIIEDSCEAHGAEYNGKKVGSFGDLATFSFFASHHITTMEGGMVVTNNKDYYEIGKSLRTFGWIRDLSYKNKIEKKFSHIDPRFLFVNFGYNFRPTELQGAFGIHQIKKLENFVKIRIQNTEYWNKKLNRFSKFLLLPHIEKQYKVPHLFYPITVIENDLFTKKELVNYLEKRGIETRPLMSGNIVQQPVIRYLNYKKKGKLENAEYIMKNSFGIGNHHQVDKRRRKYVVDVITEFINSKM